MALFLPAAELQLARGESFRDTALVLSRFLSALMIRTFDQEEVEEFAEHASIPVINGLTDESHPLQALSDAMTLRERFGTLEGLRVAYVGDGNNVCHSLMRIAARFGLDFVAATPAGYEPSAAFVEAAAEDARANGAACPRRRSPGGGQRRPCPVHRRLGEHGAGRTAIGVSTISSHIASTPSSSPWQTPTPSPCTACPHTWGRRSRPTSSTGPAVSPGNRPRTGCTPRRP
jgi:hypothetical protein